jgi:nucleoside-diphosphate-sugar epimerase
MKLLVTGANGFVGTAFCRSTQSPETSIYGAVRSQSHLPLLPPKIQPVLSDSLLELARRTDVLSHVDCVIHLAARVHQMRDRATDPLGEFRSVNTEATRQLAIAAAKSGVRRFIYLSSVKVNGDGQPDPYTELTKPNPQDPYGISKWEAECSLHEIAAETGLEVVILRPPLVYGIGVKANFLRLMQLVDRQVPLPFGCVQNARSLVFVGNLADAISKCVTHPAVAGQTFFVSDGTDVSTPQLIREMASTLQRPARLLPVSTSILQGLGRLTGKTAAVDRLLGSLTVDSQKIQQQLNWQPPYTLQQGLQVTADWYRMTH